MWIFFIVIILIIIAGLIVTSMIFKNSDVTPSAFGYSVYVMDEEGMGEAVPEGSLVIAKNYSPSAEDIGDAILVKMLRGTEPPFFVLQTLSQTQKQWYIKLFLTTTRRDLLTFPQKILLVRLFPLTGRQVR